MLCCKRHRFPLGPKAHSPNSPRPLPPAVTGSAGAELNRWGRKNSLVKDEVWVMGWGQPQSPVWNTQNMGDFSWGYYGTELKKTLPLPGLNRWIWALGLKVGLWWLFSPLPASLGSGEGGWSLWTGAHFYSPPPRQSTVSPKLSLNA